MNKQIYKHGYDEGQKLANEIVKKIPHDGEMFPESLFGICKELKISTDIPVCSLTEIHYVYYNALKENFSKADQMQNKLENNNLKENFSKVQEGLEDLSDYNQGKNQAFDDVWKNVYLHKEKILKDKYHEKFQNMSWTSKEIEYEEPSENVVEFLKKLKNIMKEHEISLAHKSFDWEVESQHLIREKGNSGEEFVLSNHKINIDADDLEKFLKDHSALRQKKCDWILEEKTEEQSYNHLEQSDFKL